MKRTCVLALALAVPATPASAAHDGTHDFDWDIGTWKVNQHRLLHPLTHSTTWVTYNGTDTVHKIWDGANMGTVQSSGAAGTLRIYTVRLYDAQTQQWHIYFNNKASGTISKAVVGQFKNGRGEFFDEEAYHGKDILVRFRVYGITRTSCRFDQSFSADRGKTWEVNFIADETLLKS